MDVLDQVCGGNTVRGYLVAAAVALAILLAVRVTVHLLVKRVSKLALRTETSLDDTIIKILGATRIWLALLVAIYAGSLFLTLPFELASHLHTAAVIAFIVQIGFWLGAGVVAGATRLREKKVAAGDTASTGVMAMVNLFGRVLVWAVVFMLILDNLGVNITALVAGLGIGGIAVALAVQNVLQDVFASVSIMLDKPFEIGDTIHVGDLIGTVEHIGIKTTRLRAISGEQLVCANGDLLSSRIRNYKRMQERRALLIFGVTYQTPVETVEKIPAVVRQIVESQDQIRFDRGHFKGFGPSSLDFEFVYFLRSADYGLYMDTQQRINLEVLRRLEGLGVAFAYPTQTVFVHDERPA